MLLRASGEHAGLEYDLEAINGARPDDGAVPHASLLIDYAEACVAGDRAGIERTRGAVRDALGAAATVDAAGVVSVFEAVVRIADATGIPLEPYKEELSVGLRRDLGIDAYRQP